MRPQCVRLLLVAEHLVIVCALYAAVANPQSSAVAPADVVRRAVQNEVRQNADDHGRFMFKDQRRTAPTWQTKLIDETREAAAGITVEQYGPPMTPKQQQAK